MTFFQQLLVKYRLGPLYSWNDLGRESVRIKDLMYYDAKRRGEITDAVSESYYFSKVLRSITFSFSKTQEQLAVIDSIPSLKSRVDRKCRLSLEQLVYMVPYGLFPPDGLGYIIEKAASEAECVSIAKMVHAKYMELGLSLEPHQLHHMYTEGTCLAMIGNKS